MNKILIATLVAVGVVALYFLGAYNGLVTANEQLDSAWAQVETQYQRRMDLIPNLVETVKGAMGQEQKVFGDLAEARTRYAGTKDSAGKIEAAGQVEGALARLLVVMENYPQLKSMETVQTLMSQLEGTENRISVERGRYNDAVKEYNLTIKRIPKKFVAALFGFKEREYFKAEQGAEKAPKVDLKVN